MVTPFVFGALLSWAIAQPTTPVQTYVYKTDGRCAIHADVYRAPGDGIRPAILWIHGSHSWSGDLNRYG